MNRKGTSTIRETVTLFVLILIGFALLPTIQAQVTSLVATGASGNGNITGVAATLLELVPMFWVLVLIFAILAVLYKHFTD